jgi:hypothetical protein
MTVYDAVLAAVAEWPKASQDENRVIVPTQCLYPSNGVVGVVVEGGADTFSVHDDGAALEELDSAGGTVAYPIAVMRSATRRLGVEVSDAGVIFAPLAVRADLTATIMIVANASKYAAHRLIDSMRPRPRRNFRLELERLLETEFGRVMLQRASAIPGAHKPHKFDFVVQVGERRRLLLDGVSPEASSINAAVVAHLDVKQANVPNLVQRIVYDDEEKWKAEDLSLLSVGAPVVPFSRAREVLKRVAA